MSKAIPLDDPRARDFINSYSGQWKKSTKQRHRENLRPFLQWVDDHENDLADFDKSTVKSYLNEIQDDGQSGHTISGVYITLKMLYEYLINESERDTNPVESINIRTFTAVKSVKEGSKRANELRSKGEFVYLEKDEVQQLVEHAEHARGNPLRNELVIKLMFQTGVRRGELREIKVRDMDRETNPPSIEVPTLKVDGNPTRTVCYKPSLSTDMSLWLDGGYRDALSTADDSPYLFPSKKSDQLQEWSINRIVVESAEAAGLQETAYKDYNGRNRNKITAHCLRHSFAMECVRSDIDIRTLQNVMGHKKLETTERYLDADEQTTLRKMRRFGTRRDE